MRMVPKFEYEKFESRHIGPTLDDMTRMLTTVGFTSLEDLTESILPKDIPHNIISLSSLPEPHSEVMMQRRAKEYAAMNITRRTFLGMGYYGTITPAVIQKCILENPAWYTQYTPYQAEISQGRLESLLNFQTMMCELAGMDISNASLLDEGTAAAEAMTMLFNANGDGNKKQFLVDQYTFPQTIACLQTRAEPLGISVKIVNEIKEEDLAGSFGMLLQYPDACGQVRDIKSIIQYAKTKGVATVCAADILSLVLLKSPGELGADVAVGSTQRFGVPMGYGGPHAAYFATKDHYRRQIPGRMVGISRDASGDRALRLALQTREQHIRRDRATSNICTSQALLANVAAMYAIYHGPKGLQRIANRVHQQAIMLANAAVKLGYKLFTPCFFDTLLLHHDDITASRVQALAESYNIQVGKVTDEYISISLDETVTDEDLVNLVNILAMQPVSEGGGGGRSSVDALAILNGNPMREIGIPDDLKRHDSYLQQSVMNSHHSETLLMRYMNELSSKDLSLVHSMIPLGSCTMKLNAATEMMSLSNPGFQALHPFASNSETRGYEMMMNELKSYLCSVTGFDAVSLMPNSGAQGEYAGLCVIKAYQRAHGDQNRNICLIPVSAHGTNPASAAMAGMKVVPVACDLKGNIDLTSLTEKINENRERLACIMITFPSTYGIFDEGILTVTKMIHEAGGLVYMDGANMNAQLGLCRPADLGVDVCHLNLHKTFCIPHGGGGPGAGPICVTSLLKPFLPAHPLVQIGEATPKSIGPVSAAPYGSASILTIPWSFLCMIGSEGLRKCSQVALLNANYMMKRLEQHYPILYQNMNGLCSHEFIIDCRPFKESAGISVSDIAKRLQDYSIHSPTMSWPVPGTLMIEPTESEDIQEMDRFCDSMISIRNEIAEIENGQMSRDNNLLVNSPHSIKDLCKTTWNRPYSRERAAFPLPSLLKRKFWPTVSRVDDVYGDVNFCPCSE